jgi:hypothetical protein
MPIRLHGQKDPIENEVNHPVDGYAVPVILSAFVAR